MPPKGAMKIGSDWLLEDGTVVSAGSLRSRGSASRVASPGRSRASSQATRILPSAASLAGGGPAISGQEGMVIHPQLPQVFPQIVGGAPYAPSPR